ncbi:Crp/Fnr family transcriptional regulator [Hymenobacter cellulosivorans]|uniref:Crp/Fnr family transcriptional regulator n=1 Tax=Hymenobacter cellulosivorans TaxID=2932249 RepID=A0ABY4FB41_9BACT|nr:Crp/Fnr family transcriptional regulator [Hymenobacter cellulosivorans]UOQ53719.1 Crp/Fnr family transcriptional regulator [Hymenobacter cellulosivorans]
MKHLLQTIKSFEAPTCTSCPQATRGALGACQIEQLGLLSSGKTSQVYSKGQVIYAEGGLCQGLHCLYQGKVKITKIGGDGKEQIIRLAKGGDLIGICALWGETNYRTSAVALDDCMVCLLPRQDVLALAQTNVQFAGSLLKQLSQALNSSDERVLNMAYKPVRERLADALLLLQETYQEPDKTDFSMAISREDLASLVGTAKETASRLLSELKEDGIIAAKGSSITILKSEKLVEISTQYA